MVSSSSLAMSPMSTQFNELLYFEVINMNDKTFVLHVIDCFSHYSVAIVLKSLKTAEILENIIKFWVQIFGKPCKVVFPDNYFINSDCQILVAKSLDAEISTISAKNLKCLREKSDKLCSHVDEIIHDTECSLSVAVIWAVNALNSSKTILGFSSAQLIFGFNLLLQSTPTNKPPILSDAGYKGIITEYWKNQKLCRNRFLQTESSGIFRRNCNPNCTKPTQYFTGDKVLFKGPYDNWPGQGIVIGHNENFVLLNFQNTFIIKHLMHLELIEGAKSIEPDQINFTAGIYEAEFNTPTARSQSKHPSEESKSPEREMHPKKVNSTKPLKDIHQDVKHFIKRPVYRRELRVKIGCTLFIQFMIFLLVVLWFLAADVLCLFLARLLPKFQCFFRAFRSFYYKFVMYKSPAVKEVFQVNDFLQMKVIKKNIWSRKANNLKQFVFKQEINWKLYPLDFKKRNKRKWKLWD